MKFSSLGHPGLSLLFIAMAGLQLNDPDPILWVTVYLAVAAMPFARFMSQRLPGAYLITVGLTFACLLSSLPGFIEYLQAQDYGSILGEMAAAKPYVEAAREFLGAAIAGGCLAGYFDWHVRGAHTSR